MNHPLDFAKDLLKTSKDPLGWVCQRMDFYHNKWHIKKGRNKEIRFWKKVKQHIKELIK